MIRAVVDTNVFVSGIFWKGPPARILHAWTQRQFKLVVSSPILAEYRRIIDAFVDRPSHFDPDAFLEAVSLHAEFVEPVRFARPKCKDPDDDKFLEAALAASASHVVTGDKLLLAVVDLPFEIVKPAQFLNALAR